MDITWLPLIQRGQLTGDPTVTIFLAGMVVGILIAYAWDHWFLAWLAHQWALHVRTRGR